MAKLSAPRLGGPGKVDLDPAVFGEQFHEPLVHECVTAELAARRRGTASTKTRAEVAMTGAKAWRQKGTGRARAGALSTPQRVGGGVAFGPKPRGFAVKINRKARRRAMRAALSVHAGRGSLAAVEPSDYEAPSTKQAATALAEFASGPALVLLGPGDGEACAKSFRNIPAVAVRSADGAGVVDVMRAARLVLSPAAIEHFSALDPARTSDRRTRRQREVEAA
jgi:large subunit ribosomal protein L4